MTINNKSVAKAGLWYTIGNVLINGLSFLTLPLFTRLMSTSDYGLYTTYVAYVSIVSLVIGLALHSSYKAANIEFEGEIDSYVSSVSLLPLFSTGVVLIISFFFRDAIGEILGFGGPFISLMILQALASSIVSSYNSKIGLRFDYKSFIWISFFLSVGNILLSLLLIVTISKEQPFVGRAVGTSVPAIIIAIYILRNFYRDAKPSLSKRFYKFGLGYSLPLIPHGLSQIVLAQFGKIIVQNKIGNSAAGIYGFAYTVALIPQIVMQSLNMAWGPWFFENYKQGRTEDIKERSTQYVALFSLFTVSLFCISPEIIKIMSAPDYWDAIDIVCLAILGVFFTFLYSLPAEVEYYYKKTSFIAIGTIIAAVLNIVLCMIFVPVYGYIAAIYITISTYVLYFFAHMLIAYNITKGALPFNIKSIFTYITAVVLSLIIVQSFLDVFFVRLIIGVAWAIILYSKYNYVVNSYIDIKLRK